MEYLFKTNISNLSDPCLSASVKKQSLLDQAVNQGNEILACQLIEMRADMKITNSEGMTLLMVATQKRLHLVFFAISNRLQTLSEKERQDYLNQSTSKGVTALFLALEQKEDTLAYHLIVMGADIKLMPQRDVTALVLSIISKTRAATSMILNSIKEFPEDQKLSYLNQITPNGYTALLLALMEGNDKLSCQLIDMGADITTSDPEGSSALTLAIKTGLYHATSKILKRARMLPEREKLKFLNQSEFQSPRALFFALAPTYWTDDKIACELIEMGADINIPNPKRMSALIIAIRNYFYRAALMILAILRKEPEEKRKSYLNQSDPKGYTALVLSLIQLNDKLACALIKTGADITTLDQQKSTVLMLAIAQRCDKTTILILKKLSGLSANQRLAYLNEKTVIGETALFLALIQRSDQIACLLIELGADISIIYDDIKIQGITALMMAITKQCCDTTAVLLNKTQDLPENQKLAYLNHQTIPTGDTALFWALKQENDIIACKLIEMGADIRIKDSRNRTALIQAIGQRCNNACILVLKKLSDLSEDQKLAYLNEKTVIGETALFLALLQRNDKIACLLIELGADISIIYEQGITALMMAIKKQCDDTTVVLLNKIQDLPENEKLAYLNHEMTPSGDTALFWALKQENVTIASRLTQMGAKIRTEEHAKREKPLDLSVKAQSRHNSILFSYTPSAASSLLDKKTPEGPRNLKGG